MSHAMHRKPSIAYWMTGRKSREAWFDMIMLDEAFERVRREAEYASTRKPGKPIRCRQDNEENRKEEVWRERKIPSAAF